VIVYNTSNRTITLKDTAGTLYNISAFGSLFVADSKLTDTEFKRWLRWRDRDILVDVATVPAPAPMVAAQGMTRETFPRWAAQGTALATLGVIEATGVSLYAGDVVTNIMCTVTANGASLTLAKMALYDKNGVRLAQTATNHANFNAGTTPRVQSTALTAPYTVTTNDQYFLAFIFVTGTAPTLLRGNSQAGAGIQVGANSFPFMKSSGSQTDTLNSFTPLTTGNAWWMATS
jgi:hypothetical protein